MVKPTNNTTEKSKTKQKKLKANVTETFRNLSSLSPGGEGQGEGA
jgi:hypothetical protein